MVFSSLFPVVLEKFTKVTFYILSRSAGGDAIMTQTSLTVSYYVYHLGLKKPHQLRSSNIQKT